jgi:hypothetical protein
MKGVIRKRDKAELRYDIMDDELITLLYPQKGELL